VRGARYFFTSKGLQKRPENIALHRARFMIRNQVKETGLKNLGPENTGIFACLEEDDPFLWEKVGGGSL
jgi:hypothetical protein